MTSLVIIRFCGLVAMIGGFAATTLGLLYALQAGGMTLDFTAKALPTGHYENPVATMLLIGVLAAIAAMHVIQRQHYGRLGALAFLVAFAGVTMVFAGSLLGELAPTTASVAIGLLIAGLLAASLGIVGLGIATIRAGVMPKWCGVALIVGSPPGVGAFLMFSTPLMLAAGNLPGDIGWMLAGMPWIVVGYAVFRVAREHGGQPSRVR